MNYDLAVMALEGLARSPIRVNAHGNEIVIEGEPAAFRDLARLCLLLGGNAVGGSEEFELQPNVHVHGTPLRLRLTSD